MANFTLGRVKSIIFYPDYEWKIINAEKRSLKDDFTGYAFNLILAGAIAQAIGSFFFVRNVLDIDAYRFLFPLIQALFYIIMQVLTIFILTFFAHGMSKKFRSKKDFVKTGKLVIYSLTPLFIASIPANLDYRLVMVLVIAFYGLYITAKGAPIILETNKDKVPGFILIMAISALGITYFLGLGFSYLTTIIFPDIVNYLK